MSKIVVAVCLLTLMGVAISLIDARSNDVGAPRNQASQPPRETGRICAAGVVEGATEDIELRAEIAGRVRQVFVVAGQWVAADDVLVRLDGDRQQQEVALATANLELARAELERLQNGARAEERDEARALQRAAQARLVQAERTWERVKQLTNERAIPQQSADDQQAQVDSMRAELQAAEARARQLEVPARADAVRADEARVAAAQAALGLATIGLSRTEVRAPRRGCILDVNTEPGELTGPDAVQPLVVMSDTSTLCVRAFVEELDAPRVAIGMRAQVTADGLPQQTFIGHVVAISPRMATKTIFTDRPNELYDTKHRELLVQLETTDQLIVGLRVDVTVDTTMSSQSPAAKASSVSAYTLKTSTR